MNYNLDSILHKKTSLLTGLRKLLVLLKDQKRKLSIALTAIIINAICALAAPFLIGYTVDHYVATKDFQGTLVFAGILIAIYATAYFMFYTQIRIMGSVGQQILFNLRGQIFAKLQELPLSFFNQNKTGDLISRINNDTAKLANFFSETLSRFIGSVFSLTGIAVAVLVINIKLGAAALVPALGLLIFTSIISGWQKERNKKSLNSVGNMSAEISESLSNFKVIVAFNRRDYFREKFTEASQNAFDANIRASYANSITSPVYDFAANAAQLIVLCLGIYMIATGNLTLGVLISFLSYSEQFYNPLRQMASLWSSFQISLAAWDRVSDILQLQSDLLRVEDTSTKSGSAILAFENIAFSYPAVGDAPGKLVLKDINFSLEKGKTYALVGPTGGGKTTTASLMARLFDPTEGKIYLEGKDIRSYSPEERTQKIGFILQEPFLFPGTLKDNLLYGNEHTTEITEFADLLTRFEGGLDMEIKGSGEGMSLGQKQIIAFIRAVLRKPDLLILDEATANIDTVTEAVLQDVLNKLPTTTTKVIIAHRLNTIQNADEIFFVNGATITPAGSFDHAVDMLLHNKRES
jgi:ATP-binding cassette subfamily B protein